MRAGDPHKTGTATNGRGFDYSRPSAPAGGSVQQGHVRAVLASHRDHLVAAADLALPADVVTRLVPPMPLSRLPAVPLMSWQDYLRGRDQTKTIGGYRLHVPCDNPIAVEAGVDAATLAEVESFLKDPRAWQTAHAKG